MPKGAYKIEGVFRVKPSGTNRSALLRVLTTADSERIEECDINFTPINQDEIPEEQAKLYTAIESTLSDIKRMFRKRRQDIKIYYNELLHLAVTGLSGENAHPKTAMAALEQMKKDLVTAKGPEIKNSYYKRLGLKAIIVGAVPLIIALSIKWHNLYAPETRHLEDLNVFANYMYMWCGCMVGAWLSFGGRKAALTYDELVNVEEDTLGPTIRLLFIGFVSMVFALLFYTDAVMLKFGSIDTSKIETNAFTALLFGVLIGLSEQLLGKKLVDKATKMFDSF